MPRTRAARGERIELRTTKEEKRLLASAAAYEQVDLTGFILRSVIPVARDVVSQSEPTKLSRRDSLRVLELLEHPPAPSSALLAAAKRRAARAES